MRVSSTRVSVAVIVAILAAGVGLAADRLVLRNGQEVQGRLVSVRDEVIEFEERRGLFGSQVRRYDRADVRGIELDESSGSDASRGTPARPRGLREREVSVTATVDWTDTGVTLRDGQTVYFAAAGRVRWGPDRRDGPAGERNSPRNPSRPLPSRPAAALIGRIGEGTADVFFIGDDEGPIRAPASGRLFLGINDEFLEDNSGSFQVTVYY